MVTQVQLQRLGATAQTFSDAQAALEELRQRGVGAFHVVLTDTRMPGLDGLSFTRALRALPGFENLPVVGVSGETGAQAVQAATEAGMSRYLEKPFDITCLAAILVDLLARPEAGLLGDPVGLADPVGPVDPAPLASLASLASAVKPAPTYIPA